MGPPAFFAVSCRRRRDERQVEQVAQLQYFEKVGVKALAGIVHAHISVLLSQFLKLLQLTQLV